ncbi:MAG: hypothetical protein LH615_13640, partial [Ferruginibacter sp.]|nr:hypothetical protein [Ferruginibacter sp.]
MKFLATMDINRCTHYFLILMSPLFFFGSCKKNKGECLGNAYSLKETWKITPEKDSIYVGDTIVFSSTFANNPFDYNTNKNVNFSGNALIGTGLSISRINGYNGFQPALDSFMLYTLEGKFQNNDIQPNRIKDIFWLEIGSFYSIKII